MWQLFAQVLSWKSSQLSNWVYNYYKSLNYFLAIMINLVKKLLLSNSREDITLFKDQPLILRSLNFSPKTKKLILVKYVFVLCNNAYKPTPINYVVDIKKCL